MLCWVTDVCVDEVEGVEAICKDVDGSVCERVACMAVSSARRIFCRPGRRCLL